jgi:hypothetical protein
MVAPQPPQNFAVEGISALQTGHFIFDAPSERWELRVQLGVPSEVCEE